MRQNPDCPEYARLAAFDALLDLIGEKSLWDIQDEIRAMDDTRFMHFVEWPRSIPIDDLCALLAPKDRATHMERFVCRCIDNGANIEVKDGEEDELHCALIYASAYGLLPIIAKLYDTTLCNRLFSMEIIREVLYGPLIAAAHHGHVNVIELFAPKSDLQWTPDDTSASVLRVAVRADQITLVRALIDRYHVNVRYSDAQKAKSWKMLKILIDTGVTIQEHDVRKMFERYIIQNDLETVQCIIDYFEHSPVPIVNILSNGTKVALMSNQFRIARWLLERLFIHHRGYWINESQYIFTSLLSDQMRVLLAFIAEKYNEKEIHGFLFYNPFRSFLINLGYDEHNSRIHEFAKFVIQRAPYDSKDWIDASIYEDNVVSFNNYSRTTLEEMLVTASKLHRYDTVIALAQSLKSKRRRCVL